MEKYERKTALQYALNLAQKAKSNRAAQTILCRWAAENESELDLDLDSARNGDDEPFDAVFIPPAKPRKRKLAQGRSYADLCPEAVANLVAREHAKVAKARPSDREKNIRTMSELLGLDEMGQSIFSFVVRYCDTTPITRIWDYSAEQFGAQTELQANARIFSLVLGYSQRAVEKQLSGGSALQSSGLIMVGSNGNMSVSARVYGALANHAVDTDAMQKRLLGTAVPSNLLWDDFEHLAADRDHVAQVLRGALRAREKGINILLWGPVGTGKTEYAKTLADKINANLFAVCEADINGHEPDRAERIADLCVSQRLLSNVGTQSSIILFDEAEDAFSPSYIQFGVRSRSGSKVYVNRCLENTPVPIIWTANDLSRFDHSIIRRMTYAIEFRVPPARVRQRVLTRELAKHGMKVPQARIAELASSFPAAPAIAATAVKAAKLFGGGADDISRGIQSISNALTGKNSLIVQSQPVAFDPGLTNSVTEGAQNLTELTALLCKSNDRAFSLLLSGPPGTGKSAYARHLASELDMEVIEKRSSDLKGPYVGETERLIAQAFAEARESGGMLIFDEADSLLSNRRDAVRSFEVSQVNEMLTWMETHPLPFVCTTNLTERLDDAVYRRFLLKLKFDFLRQDQVGPAFEGFFCLKPPAALRSLTMLTPADFSLVRRKAKALGKMGDAGGLVQMLEQECAAKPNFSRPIGF